MDQRLGQRSFRRFVRFVLFRKIADGRSGVVHSQITVLQDGPGESAGADFPWHCGYERSAGAELVIFSRAAVLLQSAREVCSVSRRTARPTQIDAPDAQSGRRSRVVR